MKKLGKTSVIGIWGFQKLDEIGNIGIRGFTT